MRAAGRLWYKRILEIRKSLIGEPSPGPPIMDFANMYRKGWPKMSPHGSSVCVYLVDTKHEVILK